MSGDPGASYHSALGDPVYVTLYFTRPAPEDGMVLAFVQEVQLGILPATVIIFMEWLELNESAVL